MAMIQDYNTCQQIRYKTDGISALTEKLHRHLDMVYFQQRVDQTEAYLSDIADCCDHALDSHNTVWFVRGISNRAVVFGICMNGRCWWGDVGEGGEGCIYVRGVLGEGSIAIYIYCYDGVVG